MHCRRIAGVVLLVLGLLGGCASSPDTRGPLPDAPGLVTAAASTLQGLHSVRFRLGVSGSIPGLDLRMLEGQASRDGGPYGRAQGRGDVQLDNERVKVDYLLSGDTVYLTEGNGERTQLPAPAGFAPATVLDPERGLHRLLVGAEQLKTEGREKLENVPTYRLTGRISRAVVSGLVPGIGADVDVKFWVTESEPRELRRIWLQVPPRQPSEGAVMVELSLSEQNLPLTATPTS
ncbi:LppX_LprAFG lipoprotein [Amycolatopsis nigrescens]|uniref:LppX_LprAFG lipoprotein n=1 Tax=Amycolatopsis nigrescens TaxID=381445 RepID=UPI0003684CBE|nr:LppX_LprAFG lipoprotein [Amycolatopsis nigrescens]